MSKYKHGVWLIQQISNENKLLIKKILSVLFKPLSVLVALQDRCD